MTMGLGATKTLAVVIVASVASPGSASPKSRSIGALKEIFAPPSGVSAPRFTTLGEYDCSTDRMAWDDKQRTWCCDHKAVACEDAPRSWSWVPTTPPPLTTCHKACKRNGELATCKDHILQASLTDFLGTSNACQTAQLSVVASCPVCVSCPLEEVGCGVMEVSTSPVVYTTLPPERACDASCTLHDITATCMERIIWTRDNTYENKPQACHQAQALVVKECQVCSACTAELAQCVAQDAHWNSAEPWDCQEGKIWEWPDEQKEFCCKLHQQACDLTAANQQIFLQTLISLVPMHFRQSASGGPLVVATASVVFFVVSLGWRQRRSTDATAPGNLLQTEVEDEPDIAE